MLYLIASYSSWPLPREGMVEKDSKIISTWHLSNTVKWTHILHANSYPSVSYDTVNVLHTALHWYIVGKDFYGIFKNAEMYDVR